MKSLKNVVILTAVEREYEKIREHLSGDGKEKIYAGNRYEIFQYSFGDYTVNVIIGMTHQGNSEAATRASHAILTFKPILIVFAGTCGVIKDAHIGDIVVATRVYDFLRGKEQDNFSSKPVSKEIDPYIRSIGESLSLRVNRGDLLKGSFFDNNASVFCAPIASSPIIIAADELVEIKKLIRESFSDAIAVELEGYGFYNATYENAKNNAILVRGVTDDSTKKDDLTDSKIQPKVMERVSIFIFEFIQVFIEEKLPKIKAVKTNRVIDFFPAESNPKNIKYLLNSKNIVFCGFLSFGLQRVEQKTHLGHCYFIHLIDRLLEAHKVTLFLCTTSQNFENMSAEKYRDYTSILKDTITRWGNCFAGKVRILDIGKHLKNNQVQDQEFLQKFNGYYAEIRSKFRKLSDAVFETMLRQRAKIT